MENRSVRRVLPLVAASALLAAPLAAAGAGPAWRLAAVTCTPPAITVVHDVPWAQQRLVPQRVWPLTTGEGVVVAIVSSGVDATVPQLAGRVRPGVDALATTGRADSDCFGQGTFEAGIVAAANSSGVGFAGMAPGSTILPVRQTTDNRDGTPASMARAVRAAVDGGARVVDVSAAPTVGSADLRAAVRYAVSRDAVVVAGIADQSQQGQGAYFPAAYPEVLAVAGVSADGSPSAASLPAGVRVDLTAPGTEVLSLGTRGPGHLVGSGAAYAAAFVAGTAALVRAYHPHLSAVDVVHRLEVTADPPAASLPDPQLGWGTVDPYAAVADLLPEERGPVVRPAPGRVHPPGAAPPAVSGRFAVTRFGGGAIGVAVLVVALGCVLPRGRRRRWRVGGRLTGVEAAETEIRAPPAPRAAP